MKLTCPNPDCRRELKSRSGYSLHVKKCCPDIKPSLNEVKDRWQVSVSVVGVGDIHNPETIPFVIISGRLLKEELIDDELIPENSAMVQTGDGFRAIIHKGKTTQYLETKRTRQFLADIEVITENWGEFDPEGDPERTLGGDSLNVMSGTRCSVCGSKGMPCFYGVGHSGNHCIFCMLEGIAAWSANPTKYKNNR